MTASRISFGDYLAQQRREAGLSRRQLAAICGVARSHLGRYELGESRPTPQALMKLADVLEVRAADLFLAAGLKLPEGTPSVEALLRTEYDLPEEAIAEAKAQIDQIVHRLERKHDNNRKEGTNGIN